MDHASPVLRAEPFILAASNSGADEPIIQKARHALATAIANLCGLGSTKGMTLAQHIEAAVKAHTGGREVALLIVRCASVQHLLPPNSSENQIDRRVVSLVEKHLPDFCAEFSVSSSKLTHQKYIKIASIHTHVLSLLSPLNSLTGFKESLLTRRQSIQKALSRKIVNAYLSVYGFAIIRTNIESLLSLLAALIEYNYIDFSEKANRAMRLLESQKQYASNQQTFLTEFLLNNFYRQLDLVLQDLRTEAEDRFKCNIRPRRMETNPIEKRYPIHEPGRELQIHIPLVNDGPGIAVDVRAEVITDTDDIHLHSSTVDLGNVPRGNFTLSCDARVIKESNEVNLAVELTWSGVSDALRRAVEFEAKILPQAKNVDWAFLATQEPYSQDVAKGEEFVGRREKVNAIIARLRKTKMPSTYIHGQKRIGKTSIALAVRDNLIASDRDQHYTFITLEWGDYNNADPAKALENLGRLISAELKRHLPAEIPVPTPDFSGSLAPLNQLAGMLLRHEPERRFIIILDEFDEMPQSMYKGSALADVYFSNLRSLAAKDNIAFILVGGELMPYIISSQGDKLNKFVAEKVDYFSRSNEWDDYVDLVRKPVTRKLNWHDSAIADLFNLTNGHPYYTKIICSKAYANAVRERDTELTSDEVSRAVDDVVAAQEVNSFAHLWKDGIPGTDEECEVAELRRQRLLVAAARTIRAGQPLIVDNVAKLGRSPLPPEQIALELTDLCRREIIREVNGSYAFVVALFERWLVDTGMNKIIPDPIGDEIAERLQKEEDEAYVRPDEISALIYVWPAYRGRKIGVEDIRLWLSQVQTNRKQRLLFKLLSHLKFYSEIEIRDKMKVAHRFVTQNIPAVVRPVRRGTAERRTDVLVTYLDGNAKSGQNYAAKYAEENLISTSNVVAPSEFAEVINQVDLVGDARYKAVVIVDDVVATGGTMAGNLKKFLEQHCGALMDRNIVVLVVAVAATPEGEGRVREILQDFDGIKADLRVCDPITIHHYAFENGNGLWKTEAELREARILCKEIGNKIYSKAPLGFGGLGLLVVFPDTCPNNSLPILHAGDVAGSVWKPLFPRPKN